MVVMKTLMGFVSFTESCHLLHHLLVIFCSLNGLSHSFDPFPDCLFGKLCRLYFLYTQDREI
jgi:hypothetical protein